MANDTEHTVTPITPLQGQVLITPLKETETQGGMLTIAGESDESHYSGEVIAIGPEGEEVVNGNVFKNLKPKIKVGDKVIHRSYGAQEYEIVGKKYRLVKFTDILGVING